LLIAALVAVLSLAGGDLAIGLPANAAQPATAAPDEAPVTVVADTTTRSRSVVRRARRHCTRHASAAPGWRMTRGRWSPLRRVSLLTQMWRGPPPTAFAVR